MSDNPYAPPSAPLNANPQTGRANGSPYGPYRDIRGLSRVLLGLLALIGFLELVRVGAAFFSISKVEGANTQEELEGLDAFNGGLLAFYLLTYLLAVVFWCVWTNKSCKNAWFFRSINKVPSGSETFTPGWAVGYYFIPIVLLWKPMQAMGFIRDAATCFAGSVGPVVGWWWFFWIISSVATRISSRVFTGDSYEDYIGNQNLTIWLSPIGIASVVTAFVLIKKLSAAQDESAAECGVFGPGR